MMISPKATPEDAILPYSQVHQAVSRDLSILILQPPSVDRRFGGTGRGAGIQIASLWGSRGRHKGSTGIGAQGVVGGLSGSAVGAVRGLDWSLPWWLDAGSVRSPNKHSPKVSITSGPKKG